MNIDEIAAAKSIGPLYKAWPALETFDDMAKSSLNGFNKLVEACNKSLPVIPRSFTGPTIFPGERAEITNMARMMRKSSPALGAAVTPAMRAARKATSDAYQDLMQSKLKQMSDAAKAEYEAGRLSAYQFDILKTRIAGLATKIEDHRK